MADETKAPATGGQAEADSEQISLEDALNAAFDEAETPEEEEENVERPEDESEEAEEGQEEVEASDEDTEDDESSDEPEEDDEDTEFEFPEHWSEEDKKTYSALPDEARDWFVNKYKEFERGKNQKFEEIASYRKEAEELDKIFEPVQNELRVQGINRVTAVARLMQAQQALQQQPTEALAWLGQSYLANRPESERKAAIRQMADALGVQAPADDGQADEFLDEAAARKIRELESQVSQLTGTFQNQQQTAQQQQAAQIQQQIEAFRSAADEAGNPKHPHFDSVQAHMASLIQSGAANDLETAYEQAVWANPEVRKELIAQQRKEAQAKRKQEVQKAKKTQKSNVKGRSQKASRPEEPRALKDELAHAFDEAGIQ